MALTANPSADAASNLGALGERPPRVPAREDLSLAHRTFVARESRDVFYRIATEAVRRSMAGETGFSVPEAIAVLLESWNAAYYRFHPRDRETLISDLEKLTDEYCALLEEFRGRTLSGFSQADEPDVRRLFRAFQDKLGAVGAAKALHLLAPRFFPLWDRSIGGAYGVGQMDAAAYLQFMAITQAQLNALGGEKAIEEAVSPTTGVHALKLLDEFNYSSFKKHWIGSRRPLGRRHSHARHEKLARKKQ